MEYMWQPPEKFNFSRAIEWPKWLMRFRRYREASGLDKKSDSQQISALMYCMGPQADDVFLTMNLQEKKMTFDEVVRAFDTYFIPQRNIIYERSLFNQRFQQEGETVDEFITALHVQAEHCGFGVLKHELIRDRIVVGVRDRKLTEKLQLQTDLTLEKTTQIVKANERIKEQLLCIPFESSKSEVGRVMSRKDKRNDFFNKKCQTTNSKLNANDDGRDKNCYKCGEEMHSPKQCPANKVECYKCKKRGHFAKVCRSTSNTVRAITEIPEEVPDSFIGTIHAICANSNNTLVPQNKWNVFVKILNRRVQFKADTGAETTCIPKKIYRLLFGKKRLKIPEKRLYSADKVCMKTVGYFQEKIEYKGREKIVDIYVVENLDRALLDGETCENLGIVKRADINRIILKETVKMSFDPVEKYPKLFKGLGRVKIPYHISLKSDAIPYALTTPRRIPIPMLNEIKRNLDNMIKLGVIEPVEEPTEWCAGLVLVPKPNGSIRMCVDYVKLNKYVQREIYPMPFTENILGRLNKAKYFSKMDANHGFWQCELDSESQLLTTFITPFGRFKFKRLPFGINAAPEFFQKRMSQILEGLDGVQVNIDDILVYGMTIEEHDNRLHCVFQNLLKAGVTLNIDKCEFGVTQVKFLGHVIDENGIHIDSDRVTAIREMEKPQNISELRSLLGSINYLSKFIPGLATKAHVLNDLLSEKNEFLWGPTQQKAFNDIKEDLIKAPILAWFDPHRETVITADASSYGIGAVLKQKQDDGNFRPIAYASKTLTTHQKNWAQIEKEGYSLVWACDRFKNYITGIKVTLETDHKPLVPILSTKELDDITPKLQRMRLRLSRYTYDIRHVPGKELHTADILSRRPLKYTENDDDLEPEIVAYVNMITSNFPSSDRRLQEIVEAQSKDDISVKLKNYSINGWPKKDELDADMKPYWQYKSEISVQENIVMKSSQIYIPGGPLRKDILQRIHEGHLGIVKCRARIRYSVWWPRISVEIEELIKNCPQCIMESTNLHETLIPSKFPQRPWQKIGMDLFKFNGKWFLLVTDYYSRFPEVTPMTSLRETEVISHLKSIFARHGTPEEVFSDNGTHFGPLLTSEFTKFKNDWGFQHITSSPKYPQSNGFIEASVKIIKRCLQKSDDHYKALLNYRSTPLSNGFSPAELLMGRRLRTLVPNMAAQLEPKVPDKKTVQQYEEQERKKQKVYYDQRHRARDLPELEKGDIVWIIDLRRYGKVIDKLISPRSYLLETARRKVRRNRYHLIKTSKINCEEDEVDMDLADETPQLQNPVQELNQQSSQDDGQQITRSGRRINHPQRLIETC